MDKFPRGVNGTSNGFTKHMARRKPFFVKYKYKKNQISLMEFYKIKKMIISFVRSNNI